MTEDNRVITFVLANDSMSPNFIENDVLFTKEVDIYPISKIKTHIGLGAEPLFVIKIKDRVWFRKVRYVDGQGDDYIKLIPINPEHNSHVVAIHDVRAMFKPFRMERMNPFPLI